MNDGSVRTGHAPEVRADSHSRRRSRLMSASTPAASTTSTSTSSPSCASLESHQSPGPTRLQEAKPSPELLMTQVSESTLLRPPSWRDHESEPPRRCSSESEEALERANRSLARVRSQFSIELLLPQEPSLLEYRALGDNRVRESEIAGETEKRLEWQLAEIMRQGGLGAPSSAHASSSELAAQISRESGIAIDEVAAIMDMVQQNLQGIVLQEHAVRRAQSSVAFQYRSLDGLIQSYQQAPAPTRADTLLPHITATAESLDTLFETYASKVAQLECQSANLSKCANVLVERIISSTTAGPTRLVSVVKQQQQQHHYAPSTPVLITSTTTTTTAATITASSTIATTTSSTGSPSISAPALISTTNLVAAASASQSSASQHNSEPLLLYWLTSISMQHVYSILADARMTLDRLVTCTAQELRSIGITDPETLALLVTRISTIPSGPDFTRGWQAGFTRCHLVMIQSLTPSSHDATPKQLQKKALQTRRPTFLGHGSASGCASQPTIDF